jgi:uncharacterized protein (DUF1810 family)
MEQDLSRFLTAQENKFEQALSEIKSGRKRTHWMWYIFPQFKGLGYSETARFYSIQSLDEARNYLAHPILGERLKLISQELLKLNDNYNANRIFGHPDDLKLKSSMTLFSVIDSSEEKIFKKVIDNFFDGKFDDKTLSFLKI